MMQVVSQAMRAVHRAGPAASRPSPRPAAGSARREQAGAPSWWPPVASSLP